jgi:hypothetical protein
MTGFSKGNTMQAFPNYCFEVVIGKFGFPVVDTDEY